MDTGNPLTTLMTRRTVVRTGAKLAYVAPLVATSVKLSATNTADAVSFGSTCNAHSVFYSSVAFSDDSGDVFYSPACCVCSAPPCPGAVCFFADYDLTNPECAWDLPADCQDADRHCFVGCERVPCSSPPCGPPTPTQGVASASEA